MWPLLPTCEEEGAGPLNPGEFSWLPWFGKVSGTWLEKEGL